MNRIDEIILWNCLILILLLIFIRIKIPDVSYEDRCELFYGEEWEWERTNSFGNTCVKKDYVTLEIIDREPLNTSEEALLERCTIPKPFDFTKWGVDCE